MILQELLIQEKVEVLAHLMVVVVHQVMVQQVVVVLSYLDGLQQMLL